MDADRFPRIPDGRLYEGFQEIALHNLPVAAHQENQEIIDHLTARIRADGQLDPQCHARSRPPVAEAEAAGRLLELAYWTGVRLHMVHGTIPRTFDLIDWHRTQGVAATGETCIQYLVLTEQALRSLGGRAKCNPPLRTRGDVDALWERLRNRKIDIVTSDHSPYPLANKETGSILKRMLGCPGRKRWAHCSTAKAWRAVGFHSLPSWKHWQSSRRTSSDKTQRVPGGRAGCGFCDL